MNHPNTKLAVGATNDKSLKITAKAIRALMAIHSEAFIPEIGFMVDKAVRQNDGMGVWERTLQKLAKMTKLPARKLGHCHEAHLVVQIAGASLFTGLPGGLSFDVYRHLSRILHVDENDTWKKTMILKAAYASGRGIPNYQLARMISGMLAGHRVPNGERGSFHYRLLIHPASSVDAGVALSSVAA